MDVLHPNVELNRPSAARSSATLPCAVWIYVAMPQPSFKPGWTNVDTGDTHQVAD